MFDLGSYESTEFMLFHGAINALLATHNQCSNMDCTICPLSENDIRSLYDALSVAGLVVSVGFDPQHLSSLSKVQAERLLEIWGKKYGYVMQWYSERFAGESDE